MSWELIIIIVLAVLVIVEGFGLVNILLKYERSEAEADSMYRYFSNAYDAMKAAYLRMKEVDRLGSFEADDETGFVFRVMKQEMKALNDQFNLDDDTEWLNDVNDDQEGRDISRT